jgi:hypothetical protein
MAENDTMSFLGRKIFFLHPSAVIQNQIVSELTQEEFEAYIVKDPAKLRRMLKKYPDSVVFANISDGMKESAWEAWIKDVAADSEMSKVDIGIVAASEDDTLKRKYIGQLRVRCGYTVLKPDLSFVIKQFVGILNNVNAKGRRKYIRALTDKEVNTTINLPVNGTFINGVIKDISTAGFSCSFTEDPNLTKNSLFTDIQIRLQTQLLKAEGVVFGSRLMDEAQKIYVFLLTQRISPDVKTRIRKFISSFLQNRIDSEFK